MKIRCSLILFRYYFVFAMLIDTPLSFSDMPRCRHFFITLIFATLRLRRLLMIRRHYDCLRHADAFRFSLMLTLLMPLRRRIRLR